MGRTVVTFVIRRLLPVHRRACLLRCFLLTHLQGEENEPSGVPYMATTQGYCDLVEGDIALCARCSSSSPQRSKVL
eukprot:1999225-Amphidinium_carterae.1